MAYNVTEKDKDDSLMRDTRDKIEREGIIAAALLRTYFKPLSTAAFKNYASFGAFPNLDEHKTTLTNLLNTQYDGTSKEFISQVRDSLGAPENSAELNELINAQNEINKSMDIVSATKFITETTNKDLNRSVRDIIVAAALVGIVLSDEEVAKMGKKKFDELSRGRLDTISMTQTQQAAEGAKNSEMQTLVRNTAIFVAANVNLGRDKIQKTWKTVRDNRVRRAHMAAESQTVEFNTPYIVGRQRLMYPGDTSLGASLDNIINCRCSSIKSIVRA